MPATAEITELLREWRKGSPEAEDRLFELVLPDLRRLAHYLMRGERRGHSLEATELVDQVYLRLVRAKDRDWQNRRHFFAIAGRAMRRHLIDHARARRHAGANRPGENVVALEELRSILPAAAPGAESIDLALAVDGLLDELAQTKPDWCTVVELKFFLGMTDEEAAEALGLKLRTMQRMWLEARRWLFERWEPEARVPRTSFKPPPGAGTPDGRR